MGQYDLKDEVWWSGIMALGRKVTRRAKGMEG